MGNSAFGGSGSGRSPDDSSFGFFAGQGGAPGGSPTGPAPGGPSPFGGAPPSQFGGPAGPAAAPSFGTPTYGPGGPSAANPYGAPSSVVAGGGSSGRSLRSKIGITLLSLFVLGAAFSGFRTFQHHRGITVPQTLGGLSRSTDPRFMSVLDLTKKSVQQENPNFNLDAGVYGDAKGVAFLLIGRGDVNVGNELASFKGTSSQVGANTCVVESDKSAVGCLRTGGQLTVIVFTSYGGGDLTRASGMVDEAWGQQ